jgi:hypothetical protein
LFPACKLRPGHSQAVSNSCSEPRIKAKRIFSHGSSTAKNTDKTSKDRDKTKTSSPMIDDVAVRLFWYSNHVLVLSYPVLV